MKTRNSFLFSLGLTFLAAGCARGPAAIEAGAYDARVIGGTPVQADETLAKHVVLLRTRGATSRQFCTGALIRADLVLTAAHCMVGLRPSLQELEIQDADDFEIVFSPDVMTQDATRVRHPREVLLHPRFFSKSTLCQLNSNAIGCELYNQTPWQKQPPKEDLALIRLDSLAPSDAVSARLSPVMPASPVSLVITGGGLRGVLPNRYQTIEQIRNISGRLDRFEKQVQFTWSFFGREKQNGWRTSNGEICIDETEAQSTAAGDSGAPLFVQTERGLEILGVYSTMTKNATYEGREMPRFACYMDLIKSGDWIKSVLYKSP
jgi:hypothetical protein